MGEFSSNIGKIPASNRYKTLLATWATLVSFLAYISTLKMETCPSETSVYFQQSTRYEDRTLRESKASRT
jgi:hypothetical protein